MRVSSPITPSFKGTLKSTRMNTRLPAGSRSLIESFGMGVREQDAVFNGDGNHDLAQTLLNGGGVNIKFAPQTGHEATATFTVPATYTGGNENGPYPTLTTKPGSGYEFVTDPAGECGVHFTVLSSN